MQHSASRSDSGNPSGAVPESSPEAGPSAKTVSPPPLAIRLLRLALALAVLWFIMYVLAPLPLAHFTPMRIFSEAAKENNISPGALYYTDVPSSTDAEMNNRDSIRYFSGKNRESGK